MLHDLSGFKLSAPSRDCLPTAFDEALPGICPDRSLQDLSLFSPQVSALPALAMEAAADACRQGSLQIIQSLPNNELQRLLAKTDEDGR